MQYVSNAEYSRQKSALTRAINSGDPDKVIATCRKTVGEWDGKAWPDDWHRWNIALGDATRGRLDMDSLSYSA